MLNSAYGHHALTALTGLGTPRAVASAAGKSIVAGLVTAGRFPAPLQPAATTAS